MCRAYDAAISHSGSNIARRAYQFHGTDGFPCPGIDRQVSTRSFGFRTSLQPTLTLNRAASDHVYQIPLALVRKAFREPSSGLSFPWVQFERFLETF